MRPFISFLTDFGPDSAAAICRGVMLGIAPDSQIVDISHSVRKYAIRDGAFLLWSALVWMPVGVHVGVVDPGVGTARRPIGLLTGRGDTLIGPDNGLLMPAAERLGGIRAARELENRAWMLPDRSATFHGRDVFAPIAGHLAIGGRFEDVGREVDPASLQALRFPDATVRADALETSVRYIDSFGNVRLAGTRSELAEAVGALETGLRLRVEVASHGDSPATAEDATWARTFGEIPLGAALVYEDSFGELAYADNQSSVADRLGIALDQAVVIRRA